ncbi:MAG: PAS domain-containing protein, partial [Bacillota bacterium]
MPERTRSAVLLDVDGQPVGFATEDLDLARVNPEAIRQEDTLHHISQRARSLLAANPEGPFPLNVRLGPERNAHLYRLFSTRSDTSLHVLLLGTGESDGENASEHDQIAVVNRNLAVLWSNHTEMRRSHRPAAELYCHDLWNPRDPPHCPVTTCLTTGLPSRAEVEIDNIPWVVRVYPIRTTSEEADAREAIAALRVARPLSQVVRAPAALFSVDVEGKVTGWNSKASDFSLSGPDELLGKEIWLAVGLPELECLLAQVSPANGNTTAIRKVITPTGEGTERIGIEIMPADGRETAWFVTLWDIPKVAGVDEGWYRNVVENASDLIYRYRISPEEGFEYVSPSAANILGYPASELISSMTLGDLVSPEDRPVVEEILTGKFDPSHPFVMRWRCRNGRIIWTEQNLTPVHRGFADRAVVFDGIARDVTRRVE